MAAHDITYEMALLEVVDGIDQIYRLAESTDNVLPIIQNLQQRNEMLMANFNAIRDHDSTGQPPTLQEFVATIVDRIAVCTTSLILTINEAEHKCTAFARSVDIMKNIIQLLDFVLEPFYTEYRRIAPVGDEYRNLQDKCWALFLLHVYTPSRLTIRAEIEEFIDSVVTHCRRPANNLSDVGEAILYLTEQSETETLYADDYTTVIHLRIQDTLNAEIARLFDPAATDLVSFILEDINPRYNNIMSGLHSNIQDDTHEVFWATVLEQRIMLFEESFENHWRVGTMEDVVLAAADVPELNDTMTNCILQKMMLRIDNLKAQLFENFYHKANTMHDLSETFYHQFVKLFDNNIVLRDAVNERLTQAVAKIFSQTLDATEEAKQFYTETLEKATPENKPSTSFKFTILASFLRFSNVRGTVSDHILKCLADRLIKGADIEVENKFARKLEFGLTKNAAEAATAMLKDVEFSLQFGKNVPTKSDCIKLNLLVCQDKWPNLSAVEFKLPEQVAETFEVFEKDYKRLYPVRNLQIQANSTGVLKCEDFGRLRELHASLPQISVLLFLQKNGIATLQEVMAATALSNENALRILTSLERVGLIRNNDNGYSICTTFNCSLRTMALDECPLVESMNKSHVAYIHVNLGAGDFEEFRCDKDLELALRLESLGKMLKYHENNASVVMSAVPNADTVTFEIEPRGSKDISIYTIRLMNKDRLADINVPAINYQCSITMPSKDFANICRDLVQYGEIVSISFREESQKKFIEKIATNFMRAPLNNTNTRLVSIGVKFSCVGSFETARRIVTSDDEGTVIIDGDSTEATSIDFGLKELLLCTKATPLSKNVKLSAANGVPLLIEFHFDQYSFANFYLAPKLKGESDDSTSE